jgi:heptosyltransferase-2
VIEFGYRPWQNQTFIMQDSGLACRPCGPHGHRQCPLGTHACMKNITAEKVFQLAQGILQ